jgi:hypothetical protein
MFPAFRHSGYKDLKLFLWLIPLINIINYYLTYNVEIFSWRFLISFTIDTIDGYIAWLIVRTLIIWLDKTIPYERNPGKRIILQLILTLLAGIGCIIILTEFVNWLVSSKPVPLSFYTKDIFIISIWFFVVNGIYVGLYYYQKWQDSEELRKRENEIKAGGFKVSSSKKDLLIPFEEISGFYIDGEYSVVVTHDRKKFLIDSSLDKVEKILPLNIFFRLNRQFILHRQVIAGFEKGENGKINVLLKEHDLLPKSIPVSRTKAPEFKTWLIPS